MASEASGTSRRALLRLLQLTSPALPIGAFHFSQGLESAIEAEWVRDEISACDWIGGLARYAVGRLDLPILLRIHAAWSGRDHALAVEWSRRLIAARETAELRAEDRHLGRALARVLSELGIADATDLRVGDDASHAALFALAAARWNIGAGDAACAYLWAWSENQVLAALKLVPLGQSAGQRLLDHLIAQIPEIVAAAEALADDEIGLCAVRQSIASVRHETQYTRLFRS